MLFKGLPSWIGGDRTNKKSANKGMVVQPNRHGKAQLEQDILDAVAVYNSRPQSMESRLKGLSPKAMLEAKIKATGFVAKVPDETSFDMIFSRSEVGMVRQGCIKVGGQQYHGGYLDGLLPGEALEVLILLRKERGYIFVREDQGAPVQINLMPTFAHGDREGAKLQGRMEAGVNRDIRDLSRDIDPTVSTFEAQKQAADMTPPVAPSPEVWTRTIDKTALPRSQADLDEEEGARRGEVLDDLFPQVRGHRWQPMIGEDRMLDMHLDRVTIQTCAHAILS